MNKKTVIFSGVGREDIKAKAGENILEMLSEGRPLSSIHIQTKEPVSLTITVGCDSSRQMTKLNKETGCFEVEKRAKITAMGSGTRGNISGVTFDKDTDCTARYYE